MEDFGKRIAPIYHPSEPTYSRALLEVYNAFRPEPVEFDRLIIGRYHGLPRAVFGFFENKYGKSGPALIKKVNQLLQVMPMKGGIVEHITQKAGFKGVLVDGIWSCLKRAGGHPVMAFNFGLVFNGGNPEDVYQMMLHGVDWLGRPVGIEIKEIKK